MNEQVFTGKADIYEKFRPGYPQELIDYLYEESPCENVADIGAGTGKFTRCLLHKPWNITAVEPNPDMREKLSEISGIKVVNAPAENTGLPDKSFGLVTAAQAFHWFDENAFKTECRRILTENGKVAIIWNSFINEGLAARQLEICRRLCPALIQNRGFAGKRSHEEGDKFLRGGYFKELEVTEYMSKRIFDRESFIGETLSRSYAPKKGDENYKPFLNELNSLFTEYEKIGDTAVKTKTVCYLGKF